METKALIRAVRRNIRRFPLDFMFRLRKEDIANLRYQIGTSSFPRRGRVRGWGGRRYLPYVFTEYGAVMAANTLRSERAIEASILVVRAFVRLRQLLATNKELAEKLEEIERRLKGHDAAYRIRREKFY